MKFLKVICASAFLALSSSSYAATKANTGKASIIHDENCEFTNGSAVLFDVETLSTNLLTVAGDGLLQQKEPVTIDLANDGLNFDDCKYTMEFDYSATGGLISQMGFNNINLDSFGVSLESFTGHILINWDTTHPDYGKSAKTTATIAIILSSLKK